MRVRFDGVTGDPFELQTGVFQGSPLSPSLWNVYMDGFMEVFNERCTEANVPPLELTIKDQLTRWYIGTLTERENLEQRLDKCNTQDPLRVSRYADDCALYARNKEELEQQRDVLVKVAAEWGMKFNPSKTVDLGRALHTDRKSGILLGALVSVNGATKPNVVHRLSKAKKAFAALRTPIFHNREFPLSTKVNVFEAIVGSLFKYSLDSFNLSLGDIGELQKFQSKCLRGIAEKSADYLREHTHELGQMEKFHRLRNACHESACEVANVRTWHSKARLLMCSRAINSASSNRSWSINAKPPTNDAVALLSLADVKRDEEGRVKHIFGNKTPNDYNRDFDFL